MESNEELWVPTASVQDARAFGPHTVGSFMLGQELSTDGIGKVFVGTDRIPGPLMLVEVFDAIDWRRDADLEGHVMRELGRDLHLHHKSLAEVHAVGIDDGVPFLARNWLMGRTLSEALERSVLFGAQASTWVVFHMVSALAAAMLNRRSAFMVLGTDDVTLGFDGGVELSLSRPRLRGVLEQARVECPRDALSEILFLLPEVPDEVIALVENADEFSALALAIGRRYSKDFSYARSCVARCLREHFAHELREERQTYRMLTLH